MKYIGKNPNGINQVSQSLLSVDVNGVQQLTVSTASLDINTKLSVTNGVLASSYTGSVFSGSKFVGSQFSGSFSGSLSGDGSNITNIPFEGLTTDAQSKIQSGAGTARISNDKLSINVSTDITGSVLATGTVSASFLAGDGSQLTNISAGSIGDISTLKSGSAEAILSPNKGLEVNVGIVTEKYLGVSGSAQIAGNLNVGGVTSLQSLNVVGTITATELKTDRKSVV